MKDVPVKNLCVLYSDLLSTNHDAFVQELFKVAYHSLTGALQCALELKDQNKISEVGTLAHKQLLELNAHFPDNFLGNEPTEITLYRSLVRLVDVRGALLHHEIAN